MALDPFLDSVEELPEPLQQEYEKREDGKFYLSINEKDGWALENVTSLRSALGKERDYASETAKLLKKFGAKAKEDPNGKVTWELPDYDPEEGRKAIAKLAEIGDMKPAEQIREKYDMDLADTKAKFEQTLEKLTTERDDAVKQLRENLIEHAATQAIVAAKGKVKPLLPYVTSKMRMVKTEDGNWTHKIVRESGSGGYEITRKKDSTADMDVAEFVSVVVKGDPEFAGNFEGDDASGTGATGTRKGVPGTIANDPNLSPWQKIAAERRAAGV